MKTTLLPIAACLAVGAGPAVLLHAQTELWGDNGSAWSPESVLPDFSFAGYHQGEKPLPTRAPDVSVADFGAAGDGATDCTEAFRKAIAESSGKVIRIPKGVYVLSDRLNLSAAGTVLTGDGVEESVLFFQRGLQEIEPTKAFTGGGFETNSWSWSGGIISLGDSVHTRGEAEITGPATRGATAVQVRDPSGFQVGDLCKVVVRDDSANSLIDYAYRGRPGDILLIARQRVSLSQPAAITGIDGEKIELNRPLRFELRPEWTPQLVKLADDSGEIGISDFTIRFPERPYRGHWLEDGLNGFAMVGMNNWARNIRIENCDSGPYINGTWCTVDGLVIESSREAHGSGMTGHHGISLQGSDCLMVNFKINTKFFHDVTVSNNSVGNVFSNGKAVDMSIDHHRHVPYENLFTEIDVGEGTRVWSSGGTKGKGLHTAAGATFWNIDSKKRFGLPNEEFGPPGLVFVGLNTETIRQSDLPEGWHFEKIRPSSVEPQNLYLAQLEKRLGGTKETGPKAGSVEFLTWTNTDGATIEAAFLGLMESAVKLKMRNGRIFDYPLTKLDEASSARARQLAEKKVAR